MISTQIHLVEEKKILGEKITSWNSWDYESAKLQWKLSCISRWSGPMCASIMRKFGNFIIHSCYSRGKTSPLITISRQMSLGIMRVFEGFWSNDVLLPLLLIINEKLTLHLTGQFICKILWKNMSKKWWKNYVKIVKKIV